MRRHGSGLLAVELALAGVLLVLGVPAALSAFDDFKFTERLGTAGSGGPLGAKGGETTERLDSERPSTVAQQLALAFALLSRADDSGSSQQARDIRADRAVALFQDYLAQVPADGRAWAGLASGQIRRGDLRPAAAALKMSILTAPWSASLVQWRCGMAISLFRSLDDESRELMKGQFRVASQRSVADLVRTARSRGGIRVARLFLASSPDELIRFEAELAKGG
jgi:hypothetical protein